MKRSTSIRLAAGLTPRGDDHREDPAHCVVANAIRDKYPWAKSIKVGKQEVTLYDYRCEHNPEGAVGGCNQCVGHGYAYHTPAEVSDCLTEFDESGDCVFPEINLRNPEVRVSAQNRKRKRAAMADYRARIAAGTHRPSKRSDQSLKSAERRRRAS